MFNRNLSLAFTVALGAQVAVAVADASTDPLSYVGFHRDMVLQGAEDVALSPDGAFVYVASYDDDAISVFSRSTSNGALHWVSAVRDGDVGGNVLDEVLSLDVSADGNHLYAAALVSGLSVFSRNASTGQLTLIEVHRDGEGGLTNMADPIDVAVTPDGEHVLVTASHSHSLTVFSRDPATGGLTYLETQIDGVDGVDGLDFAVGVTVSPNGASVYATSDGGDAVALFNRHPLTGHLTFYDVYDWRDGIECLYGPRHPAVSADGANVYVPSFFGDSIVVFGRDPVTGLLTHVECVTDDTGGVDGIARIKQVSVSPDGEHVYAASLWDDAVAVFERGGAAGALTQVGLVENGTGGIRSLNHASAVALPSDGTSVIVTSSADSGGGLTAFDRDPSTGGLTLNDAELSAPGLTGAVGVVAVAPGCVYVSGDSANGVQALAPIESGGRAAPLGAWMFSPPLINPRARAP